MIRQKLFTLLILCIFCISSQIQADAGNYFTKAQDLQKKGKFSEAITAYKQFIEKAADTQQGVLFSFPYKHRNPLDKKFFLIEENDLFVQTESRLIKADAKTGEIIWQIPVGTEFPERSRFCVGKNIVLCLTDKGELHVIARENGLISHTLPMPEELYFTEKIWSFSDLSLFLSPNEEHVTIYYEYHRKWPELPHTNFSSEHMLFSLDLHTIKTRWHHKNLGLPTDKPIKMYTVHTKQIENQILFFTSTTSWMDTFRIISVNQESGKITNLITNYKMKFRCHDSEKIFMDLGNSKYRVAILYGEKDYGATGPRYSLVFDLKKNSLKIDKEISSQKIAYDPSKPSWSWVIRRRTGDHSTVGKIIDLFVENQEKPLWTYNPPDSVTWHSGRFGRLYAQTGKELLCIAPVLKKKGPTIRRAWQHIGTCYSMENDFTQADEAFSKAEKMGSPDLEIYWAWAEALKKAENTEFKRFKLLDMFLLYSATSDPRQQTARNELKRIAGLRFIMDGYPIWDGNTICMKGPYLTKAHGIRKRELTPGTLTAYNAESGKVLWNKQHTKQNFNRIEGGIAEEYLAHFGNTFMVHISKDEIFDTFKGPLLISGNSKSGKIISSAVIQSPSSKGGYFRREVFASGPSGNGILLPQGMLISSNNKDIQLFDVKTKAIRWKKAVFNEENTSNMKTAVFNDAVCITVEKKLNKQESRIRIICLEIKDGTIRWDYSCNLEDINHPTGSLWEFEESNRVLYLFGSWYIILNISTGEVIERGETGLRWGWTERLPDGRMYLLAGNKEESRSSIPFYFDQNGNGPIPGSKYPYRLKYAVGPSLKLKAGEYRIITNFNKLHIVEMGVKPLKRGTFQLLRPPLNTRFLFAAYDKRTDSILIMEDSSKSTYVFDREPLLRFLLQPHLKELKEQEVDF